MHLFKLVPFFISCLFISCAVAASPRRMQAIDLNSERRSQFKAKFELYNGKDFGNGEFAIMTRGRDRDSYLVFKHKAVGAPGETKIAIPILEWGAATEKKDEENAKIFDLEPVLPGFYVVVGNEHYEVNPKAWEIETMNQEYLKEIAPTIEKSIREFKALEESDTAKEAHSPGTSPQPQLAPDGKSSDTAEKDHSPGTSAQPNHSGSPPSHKEGDGRPKLEEMFENYSKGQGINEYTVVAEGSRPWLYFVITPASGGKSTWINIETNEAAENKQDKTKIVQLEPAFPGYSAVLMGQEYPFLPNRRDKIMKKEYVDRIAPIIMKKYEEQQKGPQTSAISDTAKGPSIGSTSALPKRSRSPTYSEDGVAKYSKQQGKHRLEQEGL